MRELVDAVEQVLGQPVPVREAPRRDGDAAGAFANVDKARDAARAGRRELESERRRGPPRSAWAAKRQQVLGYP